MDLRAPRGTLSMKMNPIVLTKLDCMRIDGCNERNAKLMALMMMHDRRQDMACTGGNVAMRTGHLHFFLKSMRTNEASVYFFKMLKECIGEEDLEPSEWEDVNKRNKENLSKMSDLLEIVAIRLRQHIGVE